MLNFVMNAAGLLLVAVVAVHSTVLHLRLNRLRGALAEAGRVLPSLDASVARMTDVAGGFIERLQSDLETVETRLVAARRVAAELASVNRTADEAACQLDRLLRQHQRVESARAAALPRELVEPKGFAERAGLPRAGAASTPQNAADATMPAAAGAPAPMADLAVA
jgi:hypothetical protein